MALRRAVRPVRTGPRWVRWAERAGIVIVSLAISIAVIALLSGGLLAGRDDPGVSQSGAPVGTAYPDQGHTHLAPRTLHPAYDSTPPTSGAHVPLPVTRDESTLSVDQLLQALETGNVVVMYGTPAPPPGLTALAASVAAPFSPRLAAAGQAVILARQPGTTGLIALAWTRMLRTSSVADPQLRSFMEYWLGRGAPGG
jgi:hypothetical protein